MDEDQLYISLDGVSINIINDAFQFLGDPKSLTTTVQFQILKINMEHGGYIVSADGSSGSVYGGAVLAVQGKLHDSFQC